MLQLDLHLVLQQAVGEHHRLVTQDVIVRHDDVGVGHAPHVLRQHGAEAGVRHARVHVARHVRARAARLSGVTLGQVQVGREPLAAVEVRVQAGDKRVRHMLVVEEVGEVPRDGAGVAQPVGGLLLGGGDAGQKAGVVLVGRCAEVEGLQGWVDQDLQLLW